MTGSVNHETRRHHACSVVAREHVKITNPSVCVHAETIGATGDTGSSGATGATGPTGDTGM